MHGHLVGAAGTFELAVCALAVLHQSVPPTAHLDRPDPECDLDYVPNVARKTAIEIALSNSYGFGGTNVSLAFRKGDGIA